MVVVPSERKRRVRYDDCPESQIAGNASSRFDRVIGYHAYHDHFNDAPATKLLFKIRSDERAGSRLGYDQFVGTRHCLIFEINACLPWPKC
jgi:hypothetical protein